MITYKIGTVDELESIKDLWEAQRDFHGEISTHFSEKFQSLDFESRRKSLSVDGKKVHLVVANDEDPIGYCISMMDAQNNGEVFSLFVKPEYRGKQIGETLMTVAMNWLHKQQPNKIHLSVAVGNEKVMSFYEKFGFKSFTISMEI